MSYPHPQRKQLVPFNSEISEYFMAAGFQVPENVPAMPNGLMFIRDNVAVQFWNDKVQVNVNNGLRWDLKHLYQGFDRMNLQHLMMLMHIMGVITLQDVKALADAERSPEESKRRLKEIAGRRDCASRNYLETC